MAGTIKIELTERQARASLKSISNSTKGFFQKAVDGHRPVKGGKGVNVEQLELVKADIEVMIKIQKLISINFET
jgi:hypothetical protein